MIGVLPAKMFGKNEEASNGMAKIVTEDGLEIMTEDGSNLVTEDHGVTLVAFYNFEAKKKVYNFEAKKEN